MPALSATSILLSPQCGKIACERNWKWNRSDSPFTHFDLWYVWSGEGGIVINGQERKLQRNHCYLFRPGDRIDAWHNPDMPLTVTYIHFSTEADDGTLTALPSYHTMELPFHFEAYLERFVQVMTLKEIRFEEEARLLLLLILLALEKEEATANTSAGRSRHPHYAVMNEIAAVIRENPGNAGSIDELAARAYLSPRYFSLKFKEVIGQTIESYIIDKRIERAEYLLRHHGMSVGEVADALGYQNIYYFSKQFKKMTGISPSKI